MKKLGILLIFAALLAFNNSCIIEFTETKGDVVFWSDFDGPVIDVYFDGYYEGSITAINSYAPDCNESGNVTINLAPGTYYEWDAEEDAYPYRSWNSDHSSSITITADGCLTMRLWTSSKGEAQSEALFSNGESKVIGEKK